MTEIKHYTGTRPMPTAAVPPRLSREELERLTAGHFAAGPHTADVIETICLANAALDAIDARRDADGKLSDQDAMDYAQVSAPLPQLHRRLGLYPAEAAA